MVLLSLNGHNDPDEGGARKKSRRGLTHKSEEM